ncbi:MAG: hypothetical protein JJT89_12700 [Nitriliruptoraceae bacterium]|nr:hypothetical protein [Nitriliruptoraceae bacterium]
MSEVDPDQLDQLLALQDTDSRRRRLQHQLDDLPEQQLLIEAQQRIGEIERQHEDLRVALDRAGARQRQLEREVDVLTQRRDAERLRLYDGTVANARELKAVEAEIETTERRIEEHEEQLLEALEEVESLQAQLTGLETAQATERTRVEELTTSRDASAKEIIAEQAELDTTRDRQAADIDAGLLQRYEQAVTRAGGGVGVGKLDGQSCTACRVELSRADVGELYAGPPLTTCPQCRRLLVVPA